MKGIYMVLHLLQKQLKGSTILRLSVKCSESRFGTSSKANQISKANAPQEDKISQGVEPS
jgi:hypothetical protein